MAGSYNHVRFGWSMIENMRDAHECVHELLWLVERAIGSATAQRLLLEEYYPMCKGERPFDQAFQDVDECMSR